MDNNWIVENLTIAFGVWNSKMTEMWSLLSQSPQAFKGGTIWTEAALRQGFRIWLDGKKSGGAALV